jgi:hypothetical protein
MTDSDADCPETNVCGDDDGCHTAPVVKCHAATVTITCTAITTSTISTTSTETPRLGRSFAKCRGNATGVALGVYELYAQVVGE